MYVMVTIGNHTVLYAQNLLRGISLVFRKLFSDRKKKVTL